MIATTEDVASNILQRLNVPIFIVKSDCTILYENEAALCLLRQGKMLQRSEGMLSSENPDDANELRTSVADACRDNKQTTIVLARWGRERPQFARIAPLTNSSQQTATVVVQTDAADEAFAESLQRIFRFSAGEVAVAVALLDGADAEEIARARKSKIGTVRKQIVAIMLKTRTKRQSDLTTLLTKLRVLPLFSAP